MLHTIDIHYPRREMELSRRRLESTYRFAEVDRVPVLLGVETRYILKERKVSFAEYYSDVTTHLVHQLENIKWRIENVPDDWFTQPVITVGPDFQNVLNSSGCGCEIFWQEEETPQSIPFLNTLDEARAYEPPEWHQTLWGKRLLWYYEMIALADQIEVRLNGDRIPIRVSVGISGDSPFLVAVDMAGTNFYVWLREAPDVCRALLAKITDQFILVERELRKAMGRPIADGLNYSDDSAQVISLETYREFCVPVGRRLYAEFGCNRHDGRIMHLCGRNVHLHPALLEDLHITMLHGYGSANRPEEMGLLAGRVILQGNIDPMTLYSGTTSDVEREAAHVLETLAPFGGIILGDGYNVVPESPLPNLEAVRRASERYGTPRLAGGRTKRSSNG